MFSSMIQNLLSSSGQASAMQRAVQMNNYVNNINSQWIPISKPDTTSLQNNTPLSFEKVLQAGAKTKFGELLTKPSAKVSAQIYTNTVQGESQKYNNDPKVKIKELISRVSQKYGVDEKLVNALVNQESGFNPNAKSKVGAMGLMQLMPATAKGLGVTNPMDPEQNIEAGTRYMRYLIDKYQGDVNIALAAYNAGEGRVNTYKGIPPFGETREYVANINHKLKANS